MSLLVLQLYFVIKVFIFDKALGTWITRIGNRWVIVWILQHMTNIKRYLLGVIFKRKLTNNRIALTQAVIFIFFNKFFINFNIGLHRCILLGIKYIFALLVFNIFTTWSTIALSSRNRNVYTICALCANFVEFCLGKRKFCWLKKLFSLVARNRIMHRKVIHRLTLIFGACHLTICRRLICCFWVLGIGLYNLLVGVVFRF